MEITTLMQANELVQRISILTLYVAAMADTETPIKLTIPESLTYEVDLVEQLTDLESQHQKAITKTMMSYLETLEKKFKSL